MIPKRRRIVLAAAIAAVAGLSLPIAQESSGDQLLDGRLYTFEAESLFGSASWLNYSFDGVTFGFHLWCAVNSAAGEVCGNATESDGSTHPYAFWDGLPTSDPPWQTWVSADGHEAVEYRDGGTVHLLVAA
jgi:hypothetical protein